jgi:hypothetical protein
MVGGLLTHISASAAIRADHSGVGYQASQAGVAVCLFVLSLRLRAWGTELLLYPSAR